MRNAIASKIKVIFFDIDDTLFPTTQFAKRARKNAINAIIKAGLNLPHKYLLNELYEVISEFSSNYPNHFDKLLLRIPFNKMKGLNGKVLIASAVAAYHDTKRDIMPYPGLMRYLKFLKKKNYKLGIISDGLVIKQIEKLVRLKILKYFEQNMIVISDEVGISKPNKKLFVLALEKAKVKPTQALMIGDNPINDITPAIQTGMTAWRIISNGKSRNIPNIEMPSRTFENYEELT